MKRGDVWLCRLDPTVGAEIKKTRPCLIVSPDDMNGRLQTVIVAPLTSGGRAAPFRPAIRFRDVDGLILPDQMRALDRKRLVKRLDSIGSGELEAVLAIIGRLFEP